MDGRFKLDSVGLHWALHSCEDLILVAVYKVILASIPIADLPLRFSVQFCHPVLAPFRGLFWLSTAVKMKEATSRDMTLT